MMEPLTARERKRDCLCDLTLVVKDGKELKVHRDVLSAASPFFARLLQSNMKEKKEGVVRLEAFTESLAKDIVQFIYTGDVHISTRENAEDLIVAADYLFLSSLKTLSGTFLAQELNTSNCMSTFYFAETYQCEELLTNSRRFIHENIVEVSGSEDFLNLESQEVERFISSDDLAVSAEKDVFDVILRWIAKDESRRKEKLDELFQYLRLVFMSRDVLERDVVTEPLVKENEGCLNLVLDALKWIDSGSNGDIPHRPRKALEVDAIVASGYAATLCYVPSRGKWFELPHARCDKIISCHGRLYAFRPDTILRKAECYDRFSNRWNELLAKTSCSLPTACGIEVVLVVGEDIFAAVRHRNKAREAFYKYNTTSDSWQSTPPFYQKEYSCVVAEGKYIYSIGGLERIPGDYATRCLALAERVDTTENKWEKIAELQQARSPACGVAVHGKIFIVGGRSWRDHEVKYLDTCEVYNILTNEWHFIASLTSPRSQSSMVCVGQTLYVLNGARVCHSLSRGRVCQSNLSTSVGNVECYDLEKREWIRTTTVPLHKFYRKSSQGREVYYGFKVCSARLLNAVVDKLQPVNTGVWGNP